MSKLLAVAKYIQANYNELPAARFVYADVCDIQKAIPGIKMAHGATRACFIDPDNEKYVYKISYNDSAPNRYHDYCASEIQFYAEAKAHRCERILLPLEPVFTLDGGITLYKQMKYTYVHGELNKNSKFYRFLKTQYLSESTNRTVLQRLIYQGQYTSIDEVWLASAIHTYGYKFMTEFMKFTKRNCINDLHSGNLCYVGRQPYVMDYAGYCNFQSKSS